MRKLAPVLFCLLWFLGSSLSLCAEELWVRNRPFQGEVRGSGTELMVEADAFLSTLKIEAEDQGDIFIIGGFPIPVEKSGQTRLIPLRDVVDAAGLRISKNPALGTIDVRLAKAGKGHQGNWDLVGKSSGSTSSKKGTKTRLEGPTFRVTIPGHLIVLSAPEYLKSGESQNAKAMSLGGPNSTSDLPEKVLFLVTTLEGPKRGSLAVNSLSGLPENLTKGEEAELATAIRDGVAERGAQKVSKPKALKLAGKPYYRFTYEEIDQHGQDSKSELYIHFNKKHRQAFSVLLSAPKRYYSRTIPQLKLVVRNLRMK